MSDPVLCFIDTETTGLDPRLHQPWEVSWWREDEQQPSAYFLQHTLEYAQPEALTVGRYWERQNAGATPHPMAQHWLAQKLTGVTLVGANPAFDAAMLTQLIGAPVWHYRLIDVEVMAMAIFDWARPAGLLSVATKCASLGHEIPTPDHTAEGDVRTTRAVYDALRIIQKGHLT